MKHVGCPVAANLAIGAIPQQAVIPKSCRRDGRVAEGARLESVFTRKGNVGSNPTLSASPFILLLLPCAHTTIHTGKSRLEEIWVPVRPPGFRKSTSPTT